VRDEHTCIEQAIAEDKTPPQETVETLSFGERARKNTREVVARMSTIRLDGCPQDFVAAYATHKDAWQQRKEFMDTFSEEALAEHYRNWTVEEYQARTARDPEFRAKDEKLRAMGAAIEETWSSVKESAEEHGIVVEETDNIDQFILHISTVASIAEASATCDGKAAAIRAYIADNKTQIAALGEVLKRSPPGSKAQEHAMDLAMKEYESATKGCQKAAVLILDLLEVLRDGSTASGND